MEYFKPVVSEEEEAIICGYFDGHVHTAYDNQNKGIDSAQSPREPLWVVWVQHFGCHTEKEKYEDKPDSSYLGIVPIKGEVLEVFLE